MLNSHYKYFWIGNFRNFKFSFGGTKLEMPDTHHAILTVILTRPSDQKEVKLVCELEQGSLKK